MIIKYIFQSTTHAKLSGKHPFLNMDFISDFFHQFYPFLISIVCTLMAMDYFFMKISLTKKFWALLITILFLLVIFANNVKASEYLNTVQDISEKIGYQETKQDSFEEEKILQYDAKTGKTTEINMEDISKKLL